MHASLHIPSFPLAVLLRDDPEAASAPAALVQKSSGGSSRSTPTLLAVNQAAAACRVVPGLTTTRALARCPQLALLTPDPLRERHRQKELRDFAAALAPDFEETSPGVFLLDLLTLPHVASDPHAWIEQALRKATPLRLPLLLALAPTPDLALLSVHSPRLASRLSFTPDPEILVRHSPFHLSALADLPFSSLNADYAILGSESALFELWGLHTLGDLAALPRQGLAERLGPEAARLHDILHCKHHRLLNLHRPPQHFVLKQELEDALETLEPLLFLLRRGLDTLCARLRSSQRAAIATRLTLTFDDGDLYFRDLRLPEPTADPAALLRLLHTHLDTVRAPAPVVGWSLQLTPTLPSEAQHHLFESSLRDPNKFADTLARLEALLGADRLGTPQPNDTHRPDSFRMGNCAGIREQAPLFPPSGRSASRSTCETPTATSAPDPRDTTLFPQTALPLKRFRPPLEVHVAAERRGRHQHPLALLTGPHRGTVTQVHGPFPLSGHWWDPARRWQRVEWDLQLDDRTLLRLAFLPPHQWQLEGIYE